MFLAIAATAVRRLLIEMDDLPDTPIVVNSARSYRRPEHGSFGNRIVAMHPLNRLGTAKEIAKSFIFLASDDSSFITGSCLDIDGGYLAQ